MVYEFASTSKVTLPGAGFSVMATSEANPGACRSSSASGPSPTTRSIPSAPCAISGQRPTLELNEKRMAILNLKFQCVCAISIPRSRRSASPPGSGRRGGYFVSVNTKLVLQKRTLALCGSGRRHDRRGRDVPYAAPGLSLPPSLCPRSWSRRWRSSAPACAWPRWSSRCSI